MKQIQLDGAWQFKAVDSYRTLPAAMASVTEWLSGTVPGTVHTDLLKNGKIPDPFYRMNEDQVQWVETQQWLYRREFEIGAEFLSEKRIELVAEGLDTYADIRINGKTVGAAADMFVEHRFDAKQFLRKGKNLIEILFDSPVMRSRALEKTHGVLPAGYESNRVYIRKAQYSFGWDWGPRLATSGIWRSIRLEFRTHASLQSPFVKVISLKKSEAIVEISIDASLFSKVPMQLRTDVWNETIIATDKRPIKNGRVKFRVRIKRPKFWWPNGYGKQPIYRAMFSVLCNGEEVEHIELPFALRTIRLLQDPDKEGTTFVIEVNGEKIFCKGADWIPSDSFIPRISPETYEKLLQMAKAANMTMLRVWGGGIYEQEIFYELCDRFGLMVWQDFMFACAEYPEAPWFLRQVNDEAVKAVKRLRNHPSIVLWCGNNECEWIFCQRNPGVSPDKMSGAKIFKELLPKICRGFDGTRPYWRSSPFGKGFPNDESNGNHHQWEMWGKWKDYKEYRNDKARFVTEFGFQAPPHVRTFEPVTTPFDLDPQSMVLEHHNKLPEGTERLFRFQAGHVKIGTDLPDFIYKGQIVQAEALKTAVEHWRRRKFKTAGSLIWQLNDCWPVTSWSMIDSALRPKAAYYYAKKFFAPVLVSFLHAGARVEVWGTSDLFVPSDVTLDVTLRSFDGSVVWTKTTRTTLGENVSKRLMNIEISECSHIDPTQSYLLAHLKRDNVTLSENRFYFVELKHLLKMAPSVEFQLTQAADGAYAMTIMSALLRKNLRIEVEGEDAEIDDNYFDIDAGIPKVVRIVSDRTQKLVKERLRLRAL
ncbi:MAG TPA: glycoside hydrolase family 2 protein [Bacteroidota bacterium]|nr:glycoside hydrolase family 2 protein [Bacteroidota bacterium]